MEEPEKVIKSGKVLEFLTVANEYCLLAEEPGKYPRDTLLGYMHRILPLLYLKGSLLPVVTPPDEEELYERFVNESQWESCFHEWKELLGKEDAYWNIVHHHEPEAQPEKGSVAELIADLYQDMKDFVHLYQKPLSASKLHAIAACRYLFYEEWGVKALNIALRIHQVIHPCCSHDAEPSGEPL